MRNMIAPTSMRSSPVNGVKRGRCTFESPLISSSNLFAIVSLEKLFSTLLRPSSPIALKDVESKSVRTCFITSVHSAGFETSRSQPVSPSTTVSVGPPSFAARTGTPASIASNGTIPKCSLRGVYIRRLALESNVAFKVFGTERRKRTETSEGRMCALTTVFRVACLSFRESARASSSAW